MVDPAAQKAQLTPLLPNDVLDRLERLRIRTARRFTQKARGEHLAGRGGRSIEFADYRDYTPGDDVRFVDWNIFARLHRPYVKLYRREEEMHVVILVDASSSMLFEDKLDRAKELAAAFAVMGLLGTERVGVHAFNSLAASSGRPGGPTDREGESASLEGCLGRASMTKVFRFTEGIEGGGDAPVELAIEGFLKVHAGRGIAVVLSDFLTFGSLDRAFNLLSGSGLEILAVQILGPSELDPVLAGDMRFVDSETSRTLDVSASADLLGLYREYRVSHERRLAELCRARDGRFVSTSSGDPLSWVLFDLLRRRGWME